MNDTYYKNRSHILSINNALRPKIGGIFFIAAFFIFLTCNVSYSQNVSINNTGALPNVSSLLDIDAAPGNNKGLLIPRVPLVSITDAVTIATPATSLIVYNNGAGALLPAGYWYNSGTPASPLWVQLLNGGSPGTAWLLLGNTGTTPSTSAIGTAIGAGQHYAGTRDAKDFVIGTTNLERMRITAAGNVGIGIINPSTVLHVKAVSNPVRFEGLQSGTALDSLVTVDGNGVLHRRSNELPEASFSAANLILLAQGGTDLNFGNGDWANNTITNLAFNAVTDLKSAYNATTGIFTVPKDGFYTFSYVMQLLNHPTTDPFNGNSGECHTYLTVNNTYTVGTFDLVVLRGRTITAGIVSYTSRGSGTLYLKKNDTLRLQFYTYGTTNMNSVTTNIYIDKSASSLRIWQH
jgi:hypothetical protein